MPSRTRGGMNSQSEVSRDSPDVASRKSGVSARVAGGMLDDELLDDVTDVLLIVAPVGPCVGAAGPTSCC